MTNDHQQQYHHQTAEFANESNKTEMEEFVRALKEIIFSEREVENAKIELALKSEFNIIDAF